MNISKVEQRVLHVLAQGGSIHHERDDLGKLKKVICFTRDGHVLSDCTIDIFKRLKKKAFHQIQKRQAVSGDPFGDYVCPVTTG